MMFDSLTINAFLLYSRLGAVEHEYNLPAKVSRRNVTYICTIKFFMQESQYDVDNHVRLL